MTNEPPFGPPVVVTPAGDGSDEPSPGLALPPGSTSTKNEGEVGEAISRPAKVMRIGAMIKQLLEEVRQMELDSEGRRRLREIYERSVRELGDTLSPELTAELDRIALSFDEDVEPTDAELRIAHAQIVGWLEGLFHGIQATLFAQQMAAQAQLEQMRRQSLPVGPGVDPDGDESIRRPTPGRGAYL
ncbi:MAG TPA: proteasome activator [Acidimicrobiales bacterium]|nr:proteasome activator [Acidimicrobiales bacterium]